MYSVSLSLFFFVLRENKRPAIIYEFKNDGCEIECEAGVREEDFHLFEIKSLRNEITLIPETIEINMCLGR